MRNIRAGLRPLIGLLVIAHGLAHAVLPSRGWVNPATLSQDFMPFALYAVAVLGFTIAGCGFFNIRPFTAMMRPAMVVASAYSLVAIATFGQPDLLLGGSIDVVLLLTGVTGAYRRLPQRAALGSGFWHDLGVSTAVSIVLALAAGVVLWPLRF